MERSEEIKELNEEASVFWEVRNGFEEMEAAIEVNTGNNDEKADEGE